MDPTDGAAAVTAAATPLQVRGRFLTAAVLPVAGVADGTFYSAVDALLKQAPQFFADAPLVLDIEQAKGLQTKDDFAAMVRELRARKLSPIGVQNATVPQRIAASGAGLMTLPGGGREAPLGQKPEAAPASPPAPTEPEPEARPADSEPASLLITEPVRSGQRLFAERGDLIVLASVSSGAELIAHGNIHVYGRLRGRALAGVGGDRTARIFCHSLEADLIAIAGLYRTNDDFSPAILEHRVQAFLQEDDLRIEPLR